MIELQKAPTFFRAPVKKFCNPPNSTNVWPVDTQHLEHTDFTKETDKQAKFTDEKFQRNVKHVVLLRSAINNEFG